jgi:hypothetical protein
VYAGILSLIAGVGIIGAASPPWHGQTGLEWQPALQREYELVGWQVPIALLMLAVAALVILPAPYADEAASANIGLAMIAMPVALHLNWTAPMIIGWVGATTLGIWAATAATRRSAYARLMTAGVVAVYAAAASLITPETTTGTLAGLALSAALVAGVAATTANARGDEGAFLVSVGGAAVAAGLLALPAATAAAAAARHLRPEQVVTAAFAGTCAGFAIAAVAGRRIPGYLPYVTGGVAAGATAIAIASAWTPLPIAVYASAAALIGVLTELVRVNHTPTAGHWEPARGFRPDRTVQPIRTWRRSVDPNGFALGVGLAAGVPAAIAIVMIGPAVLASLIGPYQWATKVWTGTPTTATDLGDFESWVGNSNHVYAALLLTLAAGLMTVGLGGGTTAIVNRAVMVIIPGIALTLLIAPAAVRAAWPVQPTCALLVATLAGLGLAYTAPPPAEAPEAAIQRAARRVVFAIAVLAAGAGMTGSLATRAQTITALAGSVVVGTLGAVGGRTPIARMLGWHVAGGAGLLLALAASLAADLSRQRAAFPVLAVAALLLLFGAVLPRVRPTPTVDREVLVIEVTAYLGAIGAILLTIGSLGYTAAVLTALGAVLGVAAARPRRSGKQRVWLIIASAVCELAAIWLMLYIVDVPVIEAYTLPFALVSLITGLILLRRKPEMGSWLAYGPALVAGFAPTMAIVLATETSTVRRVLMIVAGALTAAFGAMRRQKAPVVVGSIVTVVGMLHEVFLLRLPWPILVLLFSGAGILLISVGATYELRSRLNLRGRYSQMR